MQAVNGGEAGPDRGSKHNILLALFYVLRVRILVKALIIYFFVVVVELHMVKMWQRNEEGVLSLY